MSSSFSYQKSRKFYEASFHGNLPSVKTLSLDPEVDLNWRDEYGSNAFSWACYCGHVDVVRYLLNFHDDQRAAIDYNSADDFGQTPLGIACSCGHEKVVEMLVEDERIDVNRPDENQRTPLWEASKNGFVGVVKILLASTRQIDTLKKDFQGNTAADIAIARGVHKGYYESEEGFQRRKECPLIAWLIESYQQDPGAVKAQLRRELGYDGFFLLFSSLSVFVP